MGCGVRDAPQPTRKFGGLEVWRLGFFPVGRCPTPCKGRCPLTPAGSTAPCTPGRACGLPWLVWMARWVMRKRREPRLPQTSKPPSVQTAKIIGMSGFFAFAGVVLGGVVWDDGGEGRVAPRES